MLSNVNSGSTSTIMRDKTKVNKAVDKNSWMQLFVRVLQAPFQ